MKYDDRKATITCECGQMYHVSLFREAILAAINEAIALSTITKREISERALGVAYAGVYYSGALVNAEVDDPPAEARDL